MTTVVPFHPSHLPGIYAVCMEAGNPGWQKSTPEANPDLLGHVYAGPYALHSPELASSVVDSQGVAGYLLATADSDAFWEWQDAHWWPPLRAQYPRTEGDSWNSTIINLIHEAPRTPPEIVAGFPAHLHIDLLPRAQGSGLGRLLIENLQATLRMKSVPGVHLDVGKDNTNAIEFYRHLGFEVAHEAPESYFMTIAL
jgi:ribosomal protein S18 acetylase RimI-like enzyme